MIMSYGYSNEFFASLSKLFVGSYAVSLDDFNHVISICESGGILYIAAEHLTDSTGYIGRVARATDGFTVTADTISIKFEGHKFSTKTWGTERTSEVVEYNTKTGKYVDTVSIISFNKISEKAQICLVPGGKWTDFETPFMITSKDLSKDMCQAILGIDNCAEIQRYESVTDDGGSCWCFYDFDQEKCIGGGDLSINVRFDWDMRLRIIEWTDLSSAQCGSGTSFQIVTDKDKILVSWKCSGLGVGAFYFMNTETDIEGLGKCPLFENNVVIAKKMNENILGNDNGNEHSEIVIHFSKATIVNLWRGVILFLLISSVLCWCAHQRIRKEQNFSFQTNK
eukprot:367285_1